MVTYTVPGGRQTLNFGAGRPAPFNTNYDIFDAETNDPFFLADWLQYRATGATGGTLAYPLYIDNSSGFVWNGGRFYGNIPYTTDWRNFYRGQLVEGGPQFVHPGYNAALVFPRNNVSGTFNDCHWGIRDDLNSGYVDGLRTVQAGAITINRPRVWIGRDDWIEADDNTNPVTINDGFFENLFVWLSATGTISSKVITANNCLVHFARHNYFWRLVGGIPFKVNNTADSPTFNMTDVCMALARDDYTDDNRTLAALANMNCAGDCRLLVLGGSRDPALISAYRNAGFTVLQDGAGNAATLEYQARKAEFLSEVSPPPPPSQQAISRLQMQVTVP